MKFGIAISTSTLLALFISCNISEPKKTAVQEASTSDSGATNALPVENSIDFESTKIIRQTYTTDRNGTAMRQSTNTESKLLGTYEYGTKLDVIEETADWLGVRERITRETNQNGTNVETTQWEKVYVLKKQTGSLEEIGLVSADLNIITLLSVGEKSESFEKGKPLIEYLKLEMIDNKLYESKRKNAVNYLLKDTTITKKKNGIIELKAQNKTAIYIDKPDAEEDIQLFKYVGEVDFLNQYLITGSYWESTDFRFIDKTSGDESIIFGDFPFISEDKKHIICIYANPYEMTADLELYSISSNKKINSIMQASFKNWMPNNESNRIFWATDGYLYLAVNHVNSYWNTNGSLNDHFQYIRIKII
ncbi:SH3 domain-containing protein [Sphingobacterium corticibacter]|uniref:SH3 domain-containing protein n=1 Tax=Sphingobacterium corticibacter TaxID=2171749 RepID=A0A2T8HI07_9SPHI|nr:SH3 domain-containing protein [Sphingobacterium corticibacter]PVH25033.1 SH3 domain-containing protein [Sphingobacterium corticibacter]